MTDKRITAMGLILIAALLPAAAFADGGGVFFYGLQTTEYPFPERPFQGFFSYAPVAGLRLAWGHFP
jgi:hypothetical protein